eukprot:313182_1
MSASNKGFEAKMHTTDGSYMIKAFTEKMLVYIKRGNIPFLQKIFYEIQEQLQKDKIQLPTSLFNNNTSYIKFKINKSYDNEEFIEFDDMKEEVINMEGDTGTDITGIHSLESDDIMAAFSSDEEQLKIKRVQRKKKNNKLKSQKTEEKKEIELVTMEQKIDWVPRKDVVDEWELIAKALTKKGSSISSMKNFGGAKGYSAFGKLKIKKNMKVKWDITITKGKNVTLGIVKRSSGNKKLINDMFSNHGDAYGYCSMSGQIQCDGKYEKYGKSFKTGDKVSIILNCVEQKLSFTLNGNKQHVAVSNLPSGEYRLAVSINEKNQTIKLDKTMIRDAKL